MNRHNWEDIGLYPPIVQAAIKAIMEFEDTVVDVQGYDISYYQEDLPNVVADAIKPWANA